MSGKAAKVTITEKQKRELEEITRAPTCSQRLIQRATVILLAFQGLLNQQIAQLTGLSRKQVGLWRERWQDSFDALVSIECRETRAEFRRAVEDVLSDAPRSGSPGKFTAEQVVQIIALACESPSLSGRPINSWTHRELADELQKRGIATISKSHVGNLLSDADLQPHKSEYWLNTKEKDPEEFQRQVENVCETYIVALDLLINENTRTISVDEMPGIQALERIAPTISMQPGRIERIEFEYRRHGTLTLIGNWDVVEGQMIAPTIRQTRTEIDFAWHIHDTVATDRDAGWVFIVDQLNIHQSEALVRYVAFLEDIPKDALGQKGKFGILKSMATRREFLSDKSHRVRFVYLPKHTSWLNQIEVIFGIVNRRAIKRGNFPTLEALRVQLRDFIDYFNRTFAKPFNWTYTGRPTNSERVITPKTWRQKWQTAKARQAIALVA